MPPEIRDEMELRAFFRAYDHVVADRDRLRKENRILVWCIWPAIFAWAALVLYLALV